MNFNNVSSSPLRRLVTAAALVAVASAASALPLVGTGPITTAARPGPNDVVPIGSTGVSPLPGPTDVVPIGTTGAGPAGLLFMPGSSSGIADLAATTQPAALRIDSAALAAVPEPGHAPMAVTGLLLMAAWRYWRQRGTLRRGRPAVAD